MQQVANLTYGCLMLLEPAPSGQELVGQGMIAKEGDQALKLVGVFGTDVGSLALQVLGSGDTTNEGIDAGIAEAAVHDNGTADGLAGGF